MSVFTFKSRDPVMALQVVGDNGLGFREETDFPAEHRWSEGDHLSLVHTETCPNNHIHGLGGSYLPTPEFCSSLVPRPSSLLLTGGMYFLEPIRHSFLKLNLLIEHEGWPLLACPQPGSPRSYGQCFFARLWNQPVFKQRLPSMGLSKPESLLSHLHNLATARATNTIILCMLLSQVNPLFWNVNVAKGNIICHKCNSTVDSTQTKWC